MPFKFSKRTGNTKQHSENQRLLRLSLKNPHTTCDYTRSARLSGFDLFFIKMR